MTPVADTFTWKINLRSFDLAMTENMTSQSHDLHDLNNLSSLNHIKQPIKWKVMPPVVDMFSWKINLRSYDLAMTGNVTSHYLHDLRNWSSWNHVRWPVNWKVMTSVVDIFTWKINFRSFDLPMTRNVTSDDLHDLKYSKFFKPCQATY